MNRNTPLDPEDALNSWRLPEPSGELKTLILRAAQDAWDEPQSEIQSPSLLPWWLAVAASIVLCVSAAWLNSSLVSNPQALAALPEHRSAAVGSVDDLGIWPLVSVSRRVSPGTMVAELERRQVLLELF